MKACVEVLKLCNIKKMPSIFLLLSFAIWFFLFIAARLTKDKDLFKATSNISALVGSVIVIGGFLKLIINYDFR